MQDEATGLNNPYRDGRAAQAAHPPSRTARRALAIGVLTAAASGGMAVAGQSAYADDGGGTVDLDLSGDGGDLFADSSDFLGADHYAVLEDAPAIEPFDPGDLPDTPTLPDVERGDTAGTPPLQDDPILPDPADRKDATPPVTAVVAPSSPPVTATTAPPATTPPPDDDPNGHRTGPGTDAPGTADGGGSQQGGNPGRPGDTGGGGAGKPDEDPGFGFEVSRGIDRGSVQPGKRPRYEEVDKVDFWIGPDLDKRPGSNPVRAEGSLSVAPDSGVKLGGKIGSAFQLGDPTRYPNLTVSGGGTASTAPGGATSVGPYANGSVTLSPNFRVGVEHQPGRTEFRVENEPGDPAPTDDLARLLAIPADVLNAAGTATGGVFEQLALGSKGVCASCGEGHLDNAVVSRRALDDAGRSLRNARGNVDTLINDPVHSRNAANISSANTQLRRMGDNLVRNLDTAFAEPARQAARAATGAAAALTGMVDAPEPGDTSTDPGERTAGERGGPDAAAPGRSGGGADRDRAGCDPTGWIHCPGSPGHPAGEPRRGARTVGPAIVGRKIVGRAIVGPARPGTPGYADCVARGDCGDQSRPGMPGYGEGAAGVRIVGDGTDGEFRRRHPEIDRNQSVGYPQDNGTDRWSAGDARRMGVRPPSDTYRGPRYPGGGR